MGKTARLHIHHSLNDKYYLTWVFACVCFFPTFIPNKQLEDEIPYTRTRQENKKFFYEKKFSYDPKKRKQGNRGDMRKIHVTRQLFEASGRHGDFFEKTKDPFLDEVYGSMCTKFQVCIVTFNVLFSYF